MMLMIKKKIKELEIAANEDRIDKEIVFDIYKQIPFNLNTLINAKNIYQTLELHEARSLVYQKYLLTEDNSFRVEYLFLLDDLFKKENFQNIFSKFLSENLKEIGIENIPKEYRELAEKKTTNENQIDLKKVKYNDKILHQSKIIKFYLENEEKKSTKRYR